MLLGLSLITGHYLTCHPKRAVVQFYGPPSSDVNLVLMVVSKIAPATIMSATM
jgi:hypothetical protein